MYVYEFKFFNEDGLILQGGHEASSLIEAMQTFAISEDDVLYIASAVRVEVIQSTKVRE